MNPIQFKVEDLPLGISKISMGIGFAVIDKNNNGINVKIFNNEFDYQNNKPCATNSSDVIQGILFINGKNILVNGKNRASLDAFKNFKFENSVPKVNINSNTNLSDLDRIKDFVKGPKTEHKTKEFIKFMKEARARNLSTSKNSQNSFAENKDIFVETNGDVRNMNIEDSLFNYHKSSAHVSGSIINGSLCNMAGNLEY